MQDIKSGKPDLSVPVYSHELYDVVADEKIIVDAVEDDAEPIQNGEVDLGEVAAETLGLELDPYPRKDGEAFVEN